MGAKRPSLETDRSTARGRLVSRLAPLASASGCRSAVGWFRGSLRSHLNQRVQVCGGLVSRLSSARTSTRGCRSVGGLVSRLAPLAPQPASARRRLRCEWREAPEPRNQAGCARTIHRRRNGKARLNRRPLAAFHVVSAPSLDARAPRVSDDAEDADEHSTSSCHDHTPTDGVCGGRHDHPQRTGRLADVRADDVAESATATAGPAWKQFRFSPRHHGVNPTETTLTPQNVDELASAGRP